MFFSPFDDPIDSLGPLRQGVFFRFTRKFQGFGPRSGMFLFLAGRRKAAEGGGYQLLLEDDDLEEQRMDFAAGLETQLLQSIEVVAPAEARSGTRPSSSDPFHKVFLAAEAGRWEEAASLLRRIKIPKEPREGYELTRADAMERFGDASRKRSPELALWFYDRALEFLREWASQATSGGEGVARMRDVKPVQLKRDGVRAKAGENRARENRDRRTIS